MQTILQSMWVPLNGQSWMTMATKDVQTCGRKSLRRNLASGPNSFAISKHKERKQHIRVSNSRKNFVEERKKLSWSLYERVNKSVNHPPRNHTICKEGIIRGARRPLVSWCNCISISRYDIVIVYNTFTVRFIIVSSLPKIVCRQRECCDWSQVTCRWILWARPIVTAIHNLTRAGQMWQYQSSLRNVITDCIGIMHCTW